MSKQQEITIDTYMLDCRKKSLHYVQSMIKKIETKLINNESVSQQKLDFLPELIKEEKKLQKRIADIEAGAKTFDIN